MKKLKKILNYTRSLARHDLPTREKTDNKTKGGKCLIVAGSKGMWGAAILSATSAARVGAGYVYLFNDEKQFPVFRHPDFLQIHSVKQLSQLKFQATAIGPGMSDQLKILKLLKKWIREKRKNVVVDATALTVISKNKLRLPKNWILTPHEGELARMIGWSAERIRSDREGAIQIATENYSCIIVLKGHHTLVADEQHIFRILAGNSSLSKAGTGDVLTGMIASFLSQGLAPIKAASLGVFLHGAMADQWIDDGKDHLSLIASDLNEKLPQFLLRLRKSS
ncbi:MAG: NAD(P)H-hydrate dehydratase [Xanthomonadaceae bacterium]|nr:NAD(P)H-hydrate dehydratase [Xanthomonadaceae bacterium]